MMTIKQDLRTYTNKFFIAGYIVYVDTRWVILGIYPTTLITLHSLHLNGMTLSNATNNANNCSPSHRTWLFNILTGHGYSFCMLFSVMVMAQFGSYNTQHKRPLF